MLRTLLAAWKDKKKLRKKQKIGHFILVDVDFSHSFLPCLPAHAKLLILAASCISRKRFSARSSAVSKMKHRFRGFVVFRPTSQSGDETIAA
jgi:hypothetical protein